MNPRLKIILSIQIFLFVCASFLWFRGFSNFYWDDTSSAAPLLISPESGESSNLASLHACFQNIQGDGYRPISCWIRDVGRHMAIKTPEKYVRTFVLINCFLQGFAMLMLFLLALELGMRVPFSLISVMLFFFSPPNLTAALVISSGMQIFVTSLMAAGTLLWFRFEKSRNPFALLGLTFIFLVGPFVREFLGLLPLILLVDFWLRGGRNRFWIGGLLLAFAHGLFPTALPKLIFLNSLPIQPVFKIGNLASYLSGDNRPRGLQFRIFMDLFSVMPPSLLLFLIVFGIFLVKRCGWKSTSPSARLLWVYFGLSFLPFLKIFNEQVHLGYSLVPLSVLLALGCQRFWDLEKGRILMGAVLAVTLADQALHLYSVKKVNGAIYQKISDTSEWFQRNVKPNDGVISQAHHLMCIFVYSNGYFHPWRAPGNEPGYSLIDVDDLRAAMAKSSSDFYFLDVRAPETPERPSRRIPFFDDVPIEKTLALEKHEFSVRAPFLDPLRHFLPNKTWVWLGSPDLEFDFFRGSARDGQWFTHEVAATYAIYKISSLKTSWSSQ